MVAEDPTTGFMQSSLWADFKRIEGFEVNRLIYERDSEVIGSAQLLRFKFTGQPSFVLCPEGPCLPWHDPIIAKDGLRGLIAVVKDMPDTLGLRIEPHLPTPLPSLLRSSSDAPTDLTPSDTLIVDLDQSEEEVLLRAHPKCRYNLKIADREGVIVTPTQDLDQCLNFYEILQETSIRTGFFIEPLGFFLNLASVLFKRNAGQILLASLDGEVLAAILVVYFGHRATYLYGGSLSKRRNTMPAYPLHREAMREARRRGCSEYDLYGIDAFDRRDHLYAGITRFKKQWGGEVKQRIGARDFVFYDRLADQMVTHLTEMP